MIARSGAASRLVARAVAGKNVAGVFRRAAIAGFAA